MNSPDRTIPNWPTIRLPINLASRVVYVIRVNLNTPTETWSALGSLLTEDEKTQCDRFRIEALRRRFTICRTTLRRILGSGLNLPPVEVPMFYANHGKPQLAIDRLPANSPRIEFNVSHSADLGLIAVGLEAPVGVDIEACDPKVKTRELAKRYFAPLETEELYALPADQQLAGFYRGWTGKEAYIKATGRGLSLSLSSFRVAIDPRTPACLTHVDDLPDEPSHWSTQSFEVAEGFAATAMARVPNCRFEILEWIESEIVC